MLQAASENVQCFHIMYETFHNILGPLENMWRIEELRAVPELCNLTERQLAHLAENMDTLEVSILPSLQFTWQTRSWEALSARFELPHS